MNTIKDTIISMVKVGDTIEIEPTDRMPYLDRVVTVQRIINSGFSSGFCYGMTADCDGYMIPFRAIKSIKIIG